jgi:hypothetical protein
VITVDKVIVGGGTLPLSLAERLRDRSTNLKCPGVAARPVSAFSDGASTV